MRRYKNVIQSNDVDRWFKYHSQVLFGPILAIACRFEKRKDEHEWEHRAGWRKRVWFWVPGSWILDPGFWILCQAPPTWLQSERGLDLNLK